jgi:hypothetical protein
MKQHILDRVAAFRNGLPADDMSLVIVSMHRGDQQFAKTRLSACSAELL